jgi:hypothetical protein
MRERDKASPKGDFPPHERVLPIPGNGIHPSADGTTKARETRRAHHGTPGASLPPLRGFL